MNSRLTRHAKCRMKERGHITHDHDAQKNADRAWKYGIRHSETTGDVSRWLDGKFLAQRKATHMRIYRGYLYLFNYRTLITFIELPMHILEALPYCVSDDVYKRYISYQSNRERLRTENKEIKNRDRDRIRKRDLYNHFMSKVIINDVEDALPDLPAEIQGVIFEKNCIIVFFIPECRVRPELTELTAYLKDCYGYQRIFLKHMKDKDGNFMFGDRDDPNESELIYSSNDESDNTMKNLLRGVVLED